QVRQRRKMRPALAAPETNSPRAVKVQVSSQRKPASDQPPWRPGTVVSDYYARGQDPSVAAQRLKWRRNWCRYVQNDTYQSSGYLTHSGPPVRIRKSGAYGASMVFRVFADIFLCAKSQHAGPKLIGYSSTTTTTTVAQNATPGFLREVIIDLDGNFQDG